MPSDSAEDPDRPRISSKHHRLTKPQPQGVSYNLSSITLPSLSTLPSASRASLTLSTIQQKSTAQLLTLATVSSLSLLTAYNLSGPRGKHPYLLWTALVAFLGGQGVEYWYNGLSRFPGLRSKEEGYVDVEQEVNGEKVEAEMGRERMVQLVRTGVCGVGFAMGVVGVWGDGA
jgi:autophagy-related protein 33